MLFQSGIKMNVTQLTNILYNHSVTKISRLVIKYIQVKCSILNNVYYKAGLAAAYFD